MTDTVPKEAIEKYQLREPIPEASSSSEADEKSEEEEAEESEHSSESEPDFEGEVSIEATPDDGKETPVTDHEHGSDASSSSEDVASPLRHFAFVKRLPKKRRDPSLSDLRDRKEPLFRSEADESD
jgi:hypothetical protein